MVLKRIAKTAHQLKRKIYSVLLGKFTYLWFWNLTLHTIQHLLKKICAEVF